MPARSSRGGVSFDSKDMLAGVLMVAISIAFAWIVLRPGGLALGTARTMGPGYFPLMICMLLAAFGLMIVVTSLGREGEPVEITPLRSIALVLIAPVVFSFVVRPLGFIIAVASIVMIASWASYRMTLKWAIWTTVGMTVFCVVVFYYLLSMPVSLWGDGSILPFQ